MNRTPKGIYVVAIVFFFSGLLCIAELLSLIFYQLGFERGKGLLFQRGSLWVLLCGLLLFWLLCYAAVALAQLRHAARWVFFAMTIFLTLRFLARSETSFVHRTLLLLPPVVSCIYLWRLRLARPPTIESE